MRNENKKRGRAHVRQWFPRTCRHLRIWALCPCRVVFPLVLHSRPQPREAIHCNTPYSTNFEGFSHQNERYLCDYRCCDAGCASYELAGHASNRRPSHWTAGRHLTSRHSHRPGHGKSREIRWHSICRCTNGQFEAPASPKADDQPRQCL